MSARSTPKGRTVSAFEICLIIVALIAAGMGGHATGYARGRRSRAPRYRRVGRPE